jgi:hypothetical protein
MEDWDGASTMPAIAVLTGLMALTLFLATFFVPMSRGFALVKLFPATDPIVRFAVFSRVDLELMRALPRVFDFPFRVKRHWNGTPDRHPKGTPLNDVFW